MEPGVGQTLRAARAKRGATIEEVAASTKIQPRLLRAIEAEDWDALPGEFYASRFIKTYAQYLGLDAGAAAPADAGNRESRIEPRALRRATRGGLKPGGTGVARARGGLGPGSRATGGGGLSMRAVGAVLILAAIVAGFIVVVNGSGGGGGKDGAGVTTTPAPKQAGADGGGAGAGANAGAGKKAGGGRSSQAPKNAELTLTTKAEVWVCLLNAKGNALIGGLVLPAGDREGPYRSAGFTVAFGNGAVEMEVDGKPVKTAASSDPVGYKIGRGGGLTELPEGRRPTCA